MALSPTAALAPATPQAVRAAKEHLRRSLSPGGVRQSGSQTALFEHLLVVGPGDDGQPAVLRSFPQSSQAPDVARLALPGGCRAAALEAAPADAHVQEHVFVAADDGLYGLCAVTQTLRGGAYVPHALVALTRLPLPFSWFPLLRGMLELCPRRAGTDELDWAAERLWLAVRALHKLRLPAPGETLTESLLAGAARAVIRRPWRPPGTDGDDEALAALGEWAAPNLLALVSLDHVLLLLGFLLAERRVVVVCADVGQLSAVVTGLASLLHPLEWAGLLATALPRGEEGALLAGAAPAPVPALMGVTALPDDFEHGPGVAVALPASDEVRLHAADVPRLDALAMPGHRRLCRRWGGVAARLHAPVVGGRRRDLGLASAEQAALAEQVTGAIATQLSRLIASASALTDEFGQRFAASHMLRNYAARAGPIAQGIAPALAQAFELWILGSSDRIPAAQERRCYGAQCGGRADTEACGAFCLQVWEAACVAGLRFPRSSSGSSGSSARPSSSAGRSRPSSARPSSARPSSARPSSAGRSRPSSAGRSRPSSAGPSRPRSTGRPGRPRSTGRARPAARSRSKGKRSKSTGRAPRRRASPRKRRPEPMQPEFDPQFDPGLVEPEPQAEQKPEQQPKARHSLHPLSAPLDKLQRQPSSPRQRPRAPEAPSWVSEERVKIARGMQLLHDGLDGFKVEGSRYKPRHLALSADNAALVVTKQRAILGAQVKHVPTKAISQISSRTLEGGVAAWECRATLGGRVFAMVLPSRADTDAVVHALGVLSAVRANVADSAAGPASERFAQGDGPGRATGTLSFLRGTEWIECDAAVDLPLLRLSRGGRDELNVLNVRLPPGAWHVERDDDYANSGEFAVLCGLYRPLRLRARAGAEAELWTLFLESQS